MDLGVNGGFSLPLWQRLCSTQEFLSRVSTAMLTRDLLEIAKFLVLKFLSRNCACIVAQ